MQTGARGHTSCTQGASPLIALPPNVKRESAQQNREPLKTTGATEQQHEAHADHDPTSQPAPKSAKPEFASPKEEPAQMTPTASSVPVGSSPKKKRIAKRREEPPRYYADVPVSSGKPYNPYAYAFADPNEPPAEPFVAPLADGCKHGFDLVDDNPKMVQMVMEQLGLTYEEAVAKIRAAHGRVEAHVPVSSPLQPSEKSVPTATLPRNKPMKNIGVNGNVVLVEADVPSVAYDDVPMDIRQIFHSSGRVRTVFEAILKYGHDEDFSPSSDQDFVPTDAAPGSVEKMEVLACRLQLGLPLWHPEDRVDFSNLIGAIRPRDD